MKTTFAKLQIPFPLFEASIDPEDDSDFAGQATCSICNESDSPCFYLGIGSALMLACPECETCNGLDVNNKASVSCRRCDANIEFPDTVAAKREPKVCYSCLRAGRAALTKDTEFGMVSWEQAFAGATHGVPGLQQDQFETVPLGDANGGDADGGDGVDDDRVDDDAWAGVKLPEEIMFELLRTPAYGTWQGECWLFCCQQPMTYLGEWSQDDFRQHASDSNGEQLYYSTLSDVPPDSWDSLGRTIVAYVFACKQCGRHRAHWDSD